MRKQRIAVAVSGGVDSLCALLLLRERGHDLVAIHGIFHLPASDLAKTKSAHGIAEIGRICERLEIPFHTVNLADKFGKQVIEPFARAYSGGATPNPCAICNRDIKFGALADFAFALGVDRLASGHYADLAASPYGCPLIRQGTSKKDQSYFLALVPKKILSRLVFPLAGLEKDFCRIHVRENGFSPPESAESQDICFAGDLSYQAFLRDFVEQNGRSEINFGPIILDGEIVGSHNGMANYTVGQRKGLGIAHTEALYVLRKDMATNSLIVGTRDMLGMKICRADQVNFFVDPGRWPDRVLARFRHGAKAVPARVDCADDGFTIHLEEEQFPTARGQVAAIYDQAGFLLAGGIVQETA